MSVEKRISGTIKEIKQMVHALQIASQGFARKRIEFETQYGSQSISIIDVPSDYWRLVGVHDSLLKFLEFANADIDSLDDMELAQKARYFCDAIMWVKHLCNPKASALDYYEHLLRGKRFHYEKVIEYTEREIDGLKKIQPRFELASSKVALRRVLLGRPNFSDAEINKLVSDFDESINNRFSIYRKASSGAYQAHAQHIETEILAPYKLELDKVAVEITKLENTLGRPIAKGHNSSHFAKSVGMMDEYDFIFRLTSQHLHATPVSMTTDMRTISKHERLIFLEYIRAKTHESLNESLYLMQGFKIGSSIVKLGLFSATRRPPPPHVVSFWRTPKYGQVIR